MFTSAKFTVNGLKVELVLPELSHAQALFELVAGDRAALARFLPWANAISSVEDELDFIKQMRLETARYQKLALVILVDGQAAGMVDLHNISLKNECGEIGYWLGRKYQGKGIMTQAVKRLVDLSFSQLGLHRLNLLADRENRASQVVAERLHFSHVALLLVFI